jgi:hypothetical protein
VTSSKPAATREVSDRSGWIAGAIIAALAVAIVAVQVVRDRQYPQQQVSDRILYVRSGEALKRMALSFDALVADVYWMRAIQHFGGERRALRVKRYDLLYPLLDLATTLDPWFAIAYRFGAIFLAEAYPGGAGRPDLAIRLLEKGVKVDGRWQYLHDIGFVHYWHTRNFPEAARAFERAAEAPGAPNWLRPLAAATLAQGGQRSASRMMWQQLRDSAENDFMRDAAERRLVQLDALDLIDRLEARIEKYMAVQRHDPVTWQRLIADGVFRDVPRDPAGVPFDINPWWGTLSVSIQSPLFPMPAEPPPLAAHP